MWQSVGVEVVTDRLPDALSIGLRVAGMFFEPLTGGVRPFGQTEVSTSVPAAKELSFGWRRHEKIIEHMFE